MTTSLAHMPLHHDCVLEALPHMPDSRRRRLQELGFRQGATVQVTKKTSGGGRVVAIGRTRYAIDGTTARCLHATQGARTLQGVGQ